MSKPLDLDSRLKRNQNIVFSDMDQDTVMMSIQKGEYYGVNPPGSRMWALLEQPRTVSEILKTLVEEFDVPRDQCLADTLEFLTRMHRMGLVELI